MKWIDYKCSGKEVNQPLNEYIVLDTETTGLIPLENEVIQLSMLKIKNGNVIDIFNNFYKPHNSIPERVSQINGITDETVADKPFIDECLNDISSFIGNLPIVGHNVGFDVEFLDKYFMQKENKKLLNEWADTMKIAKNLFDARYYNLNFLSKKFNKNYFPSHNSLDDCYATFELYENIKFF